MIKFDAPKAASQAIGLYRAGLITLQECDVAILLYWNLDGAV